MTTWPMMPKPGSTDDMTDEAAPASAKPRKAQFGCIVEETNSSQQERWFVSYVSPSAYPDRTTAREAAHRLASKFTPKFPMMEQWRRVFRITDDEYLVIVQGAMSQFHFRVSVGEEV